MKKKHDNQPCATFITNEKRYTRRQQIGRICRTSHWIAKNRTLL